MEQQSGRPDPEFTEKVRQEIMRFRELLNIMRVRLEDGERMYSNLFADFSSEEVASTKEKDLQWKAAEKIGDDVSGLADAALRMRFVARNLERAFEELYDVIATVSTSE